MPSIIINECPYCSYKDIKEIIEKEIPPYNECQSCHSVFPISVKLITNAERREDIRRHNLARKANEQRSKHKQEKVIETYLDLADTVQRAGGCVSLIKEHRDRPLSEFLEEVCSTNNIRFKHERKGS